MTTRKLRIILVEDHSVVRRGLAMLLSAEADFEVVAEVADGEAAVKAARMMRPDVVVMDVALPKLDGIKAAEQVRRVSPTAKILMLTGSESQSTFEACLSIGVHGYVPKVVPPTELVGAIRAVAHGERFLHAPASHPATMVIEAPAVDPPPTNLTAREMQVLRLMATTHAYRDIAEELVVSEETVRTHVKSILHKLRQPDRTQAVVAAMRAGVLRLS